MHKLQKPTSESRLSSLIKLSCKIYHAIGQIENNELRSRTLLRLAIQATAQAKDVGQDYEESAGSLYLGILNSHLSKWGIAIEDYDSWPSYQKILKNQPKYMTSIDCDDALDELAQKYSDVERGTITENGRPETNASHVIHLSALALPYASEYYPDLHLPTVALYLLVHDLPEAYAGDTISLGLNQRQLYSKQQRELAAMNKMVDEFSNDYPGLVRSLESYERLENSAAKYVKTFDKIDPSFTHYSNKGLALRGHMGISSSQEFRSMVQDATDSMAHYSKNFPDLQQDRLLFIDWIAKTTPWDK